jgi:putative DNA methylase
MDAYLQDLRRDQIVQQYVTQRLAHWQAEGWVPDMRIEVGGPPRYQGLDFIRARGWTCWNHLFNPRQLLLAGLLNQFSDARLKFGLAQVLNNRARVPKV